MTDAFCTKYVAWLSVCFSSKPSKARVSSKLDRTSFSHAYNIKPTTSLEFSEGIILCAAVSKGCLQTCSKLLQSGVN